MTCPKNVHVWPIQRKYEGEWGKNSLEIKIVGSVADKDEVHLIKNITEVFLIEQRIRSLLDEN